jgi:ChrR Cupin-like domain
MTSTMHDHTSLKNFRFDTREVDWKDFITTGCYYKLLDVNVAARTADMLVKFEPGARCLYHRHVAPATSLVLEGELHIFDKTSMGETLRVVKPAGTYTSGVEDDVHVEGGGENGVIVYFSMRGSSDHIYDLLDTNLNLKREITIHDFAKDLAYWTR